MRLVSALAALALFSAPFGAGLTPIRSAEITRVWLTPDAGDAAKMVVHWETAEPSDSEVSFTVGSQAPQTVRIDEQVTLHHAAVPVTARDTGVRYQVRSGVDRSAEATFKAYPTDELRAAVVADWQGKPDLSAVLRDDVHLLLTAGDNISSLRERCGPGVIDCTKPYGDLVDAYPALFRSTPFVPTLGNHDREVRPRGPMPPAETVYDVEATAFRRFFGLPADGWRRALDVPDLSVRFISLDLNHIQDLGTTWQTCHSFDKNSEQFLWYEKLMTGPRPRFVVTLHNERSATMRGQEKGAWHRLFNAGRPRSPASATSPNGPNSTAAPITTRHWEWVPSTPIRSRSSSPAKRVTCC